ncbi:DNA-binding response regulator [Romboutsia maritimum]|uniref:Stage 0 sporulation protein A homolog n=1 Tax=Romboutsia maritimum TaxID=2020948 RepID=A0A371IPQ7_9FIRM|nr:LytTR family DNA-binding domain-containing protein [Romboutsia maritimum]RDY22457.1 DNA-binding response regulator [Romboutsia maritimum]
MTLVIAVCEDNEVQRNLLVDWIKLYFKDKDLSLKIYEFESGEKLLDNYPIELNILFLDIKMDQLNGMDTAKEIRKFDKKLEIIFATSLSEYMQEGYEVSAYRYLIKPLKIEDINRHLSECISKYLDIHYLILNTKNNLIRVNILNILYIEKEGHKIIIHEINNFFKLKMSMKKIEEVLKEKNFFRCHNSFLINLDKVERLDKNNLYINSIQIPVSKYRVKNLKIRLTECLGYMIC